MFLVEFEVFFRVFTYGAVGGLETVLQGSFMKIVSQLVVFLVIHDFAYKVIRFEFRVLVSEFPAELQEFGSESEGFLSILQEDLVGHQLFVNLQFVLIFTEKRA